jgi:hypothetical protein
MSVGRSAILVAFVLGPVLAFGVIPCLIFVFLIGEVGTNLIWGPVFGSGFWLSDPFATSTGNFFGLLWAFLLVPLALFFAGNLLWQRLGERGKFMALTPLYVSFLLDVPVHTINAWELHGFVLPDWALYVNANY